MSTTGLNQSVQSNGSTEVKQMIRDVYPTWKDFAVHFLPIPFYIDRYVTLVYFIVGFPGNLVSLFVWSSQRMYRGNSAAIYLAFMSANNIVVLLFSLNRDLSRAWNLVFRLTPYSCEVKLVLNSVSQYASPMFVLGFTAERWLAIYKPFSIDRICSTRRAIYVCLAIILVTMILCSGNAYLFTTDEFSCKERMETQAVMYAYKGALETIFSGIVPLLALTLNCLVIREVARVNRANKRLSEISTQLCNHSDQRSGSSPDMNNLATSGDRLWLARESQPGQAPVAAAGGSVAMPKQRPRRSGQPSWTGSRHQFASPAAKRSDRDSSSSSRFRSTTLMLLVVSFYMIIVAVLGGIMYIIYYPEDLDFNASEEQFLCVLRHWSKFSTACASTSHQTDAQTRMPMLFPVDGRVILCQGFEESNAE